MTKSILFAVLACVGLPACAGPAADPTLITPTQAILLAANAAPDGVRGTFILEVKATGRQDGNIYLNSERDYRDQRCLTIAIRPEAFDSFRARFGADADSALVGKRIRVTGLAKRVTIRFMADGRFTGKYYFQTHVNVFRATQVEVVP